MVNFDGVIGVLITTGVLLGMGYGMDLLSFSIVSLAINWISAWGYAIPAHTERFYDLTGALTYIALLIMSLAQMDTFSLRSLLITGVSLLWCTRLGLFLAHRIHRAGGIDGRFDKVRDKPLPFLVWWNGQAIWCFVVIVPILILNDRYVNVSWEWASTDTFGMIIWLVGFTIEVISDRQKSTFRAQREFASDFISSGLWKYSRHPNYFGEIVLWVGVFLFCTREMTCTDVILSCISPLFIECLLVFVSGIPLLETSADEKWGSQEDYIQYKASTPVLFPFIKF